MFYRKESMGSEIGTHIVGFERLFHVMCMCFYLWGGKSLPNISIMYFFRVEWIDRVGLISHTGKCAAVFSETKTLTRLFSFLRITMISLRSSL